MPPLPWIEIELDKLRKLHIGMNELAYLEDEWDYTLDTFGDAKKMTSALILIRVFWVGLRRDDPTLTLDEVGDILDGVSDWKMVAKKLTKALANSFGGAKEDAAPSKKKSAEENPEAPGTGA
jgi:hypothetical protein